jgi:hypothetical protein
MPLTGWGNWLNPEMTYGKGNMNRIDLLSRAALSGDALQLREIVQDFLATHPEFSELPAPDSHDDTLRSVAAGLVELLADRCGKKPPEWCKGIGAAPHPIHLLKSASTMRRLRELCEKESPLPLKRRNLYAPPTFLMFA